MQKNTAHPREGASGGGVPPSSVHTTETIPGKLPASPGAGRPERARDRRPRNPVLEAALAEDAQLGRRNYHKRYGGRVARLANRAGLGKLAAAIGGCSPELSLNAAGHVIGRRACRERWCPMCQGGRSAQWAGRLHEAMPAIVAERGQEWALILLTLTVRSMPLAQVHDAIGALHAAVDRLVRRAAFAAEGWVRCTEVTVRADGQAHPHVHVLAAVPRSYFAGPLRKERGPTGRPKIVPGYMRQDQWRDLWRDVARLDYDPVVDVRRVRGNLTDPEGRQALYEVTKYGIKPADVLRLAPDQFATLAEQMKGVQTIGVGGQLSPYLRAVAEEVEAAEDVGAINGADVATVAAWDAEARRYLPADDATLAQVRAERGAVQERRSDLGRAIEARALWRGGMLAADYVAVRLRVWGGMSPPEIAEPGTRSTGDG